MFKMLRTLLCCVTNGFLKISKVYFVICFCKGSNLLNIGMIITCIFNIVSPKAEFLFLLGNVLHRLFTENLPLIT